MVREGFSFFYLLLGFEFNVNNVKKNKVLAIEFESQR